MAAYVWTLIAISLPVLHYIWLLVVRKRYGEDCSSFASTCSAEIGAIVFVGGYTRMATLREVQLGYMNFRIVVRLELHGRFYSWNDRLQKC